MRRTRSCTLPKNFYPRPPRGGRLRPSWCSRTLRNFYPRPPRGGRRRDFLRRDFGDVISIHALREEGDLELCGRFGAVKISIHALREEGDLQRGRLASAKEDFYPRPPRGGRPSATGRLTVHSRFLSTPSARRATFLLFFFGEFIEISIHALREEGDIRFRPVSTTHCNFYPRPPRGGRLRPSWCSRTLRNFYPRPPRGGRRRDFLRRDFGDVISIHALREEGDLELCGRFGAVKISIHALREEGDLQRGRLASAKEDFYPRPPRGGRRSGRCRGWSSNSLFLSTPSARRATC